MMPLTREQVQAWRDEARECFVDPAKGYVLPACAVLDSAKDVLDLCEALLERWGA